MEDPWRRFARPQRFSILCMAECTMPRGYFLKKKPRSTMPAMSISESKTLEPDTEGLKHLCRKVATGGCGISLFSLHSLRRK